MKANRSAAWMLLSLATLTAMGACAPDNTAKPAAANTPEPGTRAYDMQIWHSLLRDHTKIRRVVRHLPKGVDATTESDDPDVASRIIEHGRAMQERVATGAPVRMWDPVFADLFAKHEAIHLEITTTANGVRIIETSVDPEVVALLRSHAMGVSEFVRSGFDAAPKATPRLTANDPIPANEATLGGIPHRFLLEQPSAAHFEAAHKGGVSMAINFRPAREQAGLNESAIATDAGMTYCNVPYSGPVDLTDEVLDQGRAAIVAAETNASPALMHCRTGNRVGPAWAAYRVLDKKMPIEAAIAEAHTVGMVDPLLESMLRDYLRRRTNATATWSPVSRESLSEVQVLQREHAIAAKDAMFTRLMGALSEALAKPEGPMGAISVCKQEAPKIAQSVSRESGVMIGRTSTRRRNPSNGVPTWAKQTLEQDQATPVMFANSDGGFAIALPIVLADSCLMCHGDPDLMDAALKEVIARAYPKDQATGFAVGDLRGWFWVETPPTK